MSNPRNLSSFTLIVTFVCLSLIGVVLVPLLPGKHSASCVFFSPLFLPTFVASL